MALESILLWVLILALVILLAILISMIKDLRAEVAYNQRVHMSDNSMQTERYWKLVHEVDMIREFLNVEVVQSQKRMVKKHD